MNLDMALNKNPKEKSEGYDVQTEAVPKTSFTLVWNNNSIKYDDENTMIPTMKIRYNWVL